ncbi:Transposon Tf2-7 polyprotein [Rhizoctonia solani]|uniref:Transposon Tf2-7 polyprotein n=1 Tax=Rhizoctonia solani TaxID=456999 RepID=A0A8H8SWM4_9AGAM|nr:Transposon Tf2-7 polyprotein [Rhizoctonia solani]QRW20519.1 Transposon Tf2-7 polyprotein [Rhizoctonia solani]
MTKERMVREKGTLPKYLIGKKIQKHLGPFEVKEKISSHAYRLKLPDSLKIHNIFYVGLLSKSHKSPSQPFLEQPPPETIEGEENTRPFLGTRRTVGTQPRQDKAREEEYKFYLIKWKGYGPEDNSWEPEELLEHSQDKIKRFNQARLRKACDLAKSL